MPIPAGESCSNCYYWNSETGGEESPCMWRPPDEFRGERWHFRRTAKNKWCGQWKAITAGDFEPTYGVGSARVSSDAGYLMTGIGTWTLIDTPGMVAVAMLNWQLQSAGVLQINYGFGNPTDEFLANFDGIVSVAAASNNQEIKICIGLNGAPVPETTVRMFARQSDTATPIPVGGTRLINDQDTVEMFIQSSGSATIYDHHMTAESEGPYPAGTVASI